MDRKPHHKPLPDPFKEWAAKQVEPPAATPCCAKCKTPFGHSAIAGVCCHTKLSTESFISRKPIDSGKGS